MTTTRMPSATALTLIVATLGSVIGIGTAAGQTVTLSPSGPLPEGIVVSVLDDAQDTTPTKIAASENGDWTITVHANPTQWRNEPIILIDIPARSVDADGVASDAMTLQLDLSFKASETAETPTIPLQIFQAFGQHERDTIQNLPRFKRYEQILMAQSLALHFFERIDNDEDDATRRMVQLWFDAIFKGASLAENRHVQFGPSVSDAVARAFASSPDKLAYFTALMAQLRQRFWNDQADFEVLMSEHNCAMAKLLVDHLGRRHAAHPEDAEPGNASIGDPAGVLQGMRDRVEACTAG